MQNNLYIWFNSIVANHNWSLSLFYKWQNFAIELERLTRIKEFPQWKLARILPELQREMFNWKIDNNTKNKDFVLWFRNYLDDLINDVLKRQNIDFEKLDNIYTINFPFDISVRWYENKVTSYKKNNHHTFHAYSTYFPSQFNESVILCMDHDWYDEDLWWINSMHSIWYAKWNEVKFLYADEFSPKKAQAWIWAVYENHSRICWIWEGTLMWLSWYWNNKLKSIKIFDYTTRWVLLSKEFLSKNSYNWLDNFREDIINWFRKVYNIDWKWEVKNIEKSIYSDIADKVQSEIEEAVLFLARKAYKLTWCKNICIAWWVWLNIIANNRILRETEFENIFVQPACNDAGLSLWWLYYLYHNILWNKKRTRLVSPWLWFKYSNEDIKKELNKFDDKIQYEKLWNNFYEKVAKILSENKIIWWFEWKSEFWPRALWFRSILASPISKEMKNKVNNIKWREQYRPLAPIMLEDDFKNYLKTNYASPYMTLVAEVYENKKNKIPAVVHIDWTARYQTVNEKQNFKVYNLLKEFKKITWESVLINTSFNQHDEPIIEKPEDAIKMFLATDIDYLVIWNYLVSKEKKYLEYRFDKRYYEKLFDNKIEQVKNNNIRWETILKLLWIKNLWFNYNYDIWDKWIKLNNNDLKIIIEIVKSWFEYYYKVDNIWIRIIEKWINKKLLEIIKIFLKKNSKIIYDLIKWI